MKQNFIFTLLALFSMLSLVSCSDWTETEALDSTVKKPWEQDPALWAEYTATLRAYKQSEHFIVYARMHNSPEKATGEQDFMRCLPDSLDIVTLTNADNFSKFDAEDMSVTPTWIRSSLPSLPMAWTATRSRPTRWLRMPRLALLIGLPRPELTVSSSFSRVIPCRSLPPTVQRWITSSSIRRNSKMFWM